MAIALNAAPEPERWHTEICQVDNSQFHHAASPEAIRSSAAAMRRLEAINMPLSPVRPAGITPFSIMR